MYNSLNEYSPRKKPKETLVYLLLQFIHVCHSTNTIDENKKIIWSNDLRSIVSTEDCQCFNELLTYAVGRWALVNARWLLISGFQNGFAQQLFVARR